MWPIATIALCFVAFVAVWLTKWLQKWRNPVWNGQLPPGSMGFPFAGETGRFFKPQSSFDIHPFIKDRMERYGPVFKTSLLGWPMVVSTDPQFSHFILQQDGISVEQWYSKTFRELLGQQILSTSTGFLHKYLRNMILEQFGPEKQKEKLLNEIEDMASRNLAIWSKQELVEVKEVVTMLAFGLGSMKMMSYDASKDYDNLKDTYTSLLKGLFSFPLNIPGTVFHKSLKDRNRAVRVIKDIVKDRIYSTKKHGDFLDAIIEDMKKEEPLFNVDSAACYVFVLLFTTFEAVSFALSLAIKFISDHPSVLKDLTDEHEQILKNRENVGSPLTWKEYKSMTFTSHVIDETLRLGGIPTFIFRRATRDILIDRYTIPSGWVIFLYPQAIHLNPDKYEDAATFNPWRWKGQGSNIASKNFVAFGGGMRVCPGAEFAKLQMSVVLHLLVTKYRWTKVRGGEVVMAPGAVFPSGFHIRVVEKD